MKIIEWIWLWRDPGFAIPRTHGIVYFDHNRRRALCVVVPINVIARLAVVLWAQLRQPVVFTEHERQVCERRAAGLCMLCSGLVRFPGVEGYMYQSRNGPVCKRCGDEFRGGET